MSWFYWDYNELSWIQQDTLQVLINEVCVLFIIFIQDKLIYNGKNWRQNKFAIKMIPNPRENYDKTIETTLNDKFAHV